MASSSKILSSLILLLNVWSHVILAFLPNHHGRHNHHVSSYHYTSSMTTTTILCAENFDPKSLLYAEHEKLLVQRGQFEGELLAKSKYPPVPLEVNVVKGAGGGGGFGGGGASSKKSLLKTQGKAHAQVLKERGVVPRLGPGARAAFCASLPRKWMLAACTQDRLLA